MITRIFTLLVLVSISLGGFAQGDVKYGETPEQQTLCKEALSIYRGFRDQKNYDDAYPAWRKTCDVCPETVSQRLYSDGVKFLKNEIKKSKGTDRVAVLVDSLFMTYDKRMELYPSTPKKPNNACHILGFKATDMKKYRPNEALATFEMFSEVVNCIEEQSKASFLSSYYLGLYNLYKEAEGEQKAEYEEKLLIDYLMLQEYADFGAENGKDDKTKEGYVKAKNNIDEIFILVAECDRMVPILENKVNNHPEDIDLMKKVLKLMDKKDCTETAFYLGTAEKLCEIEPSSDCSRSIAVSYAKKKQYSKAMTYLEKAIEYCTDCEEEESILLSAGQVSSNLGQSKKAHSYAKQVLKINPNNGAAIILIGDVIYGSTAQCDDGKLGSYGAYWLAADYYSRAKSKDSSVAQKANKKIAACKSQFPSRSDLFSYGKKDGESFTVSYWGETTTIRERIE